MSTRWVMDNGLGLCAYCHKFDRYGFEQDPYSKHNMQIIMDKLGEERFKQLEQLHNQPTKFTMEDLLELEAAFKQALQPEL